MGLFFNKNKKDIKSELATEAQKTTMRRAGISFDDKTTKIEAMNKLKAFFAFATPEQRLSAFPMRPTRRRQCWYEDDYDYEMDEHFHLPEGYF